MKAPSEAYRDTRERLTELLEGVDDRRARTDVPSTPEWTVKDVMAHLLGLVCDWLDGRTNNYGTEEWTAAQVEARRDWPLDRVLEEWSTRAPDLEARMDDPVEHGFPDYMPFLAVRDAVMHEHDIRGALDLPGGQDSSGVELGMKVSVGGVRRRHAETSLGPLVIRETDGRDWPIGTGDPVASLAAPRFDLFRALGGRRSRDQVLGFDWTGDSTAYVDHLISGGFSWATQDLDY